MARHVVSRSGSEKTDDLGELRSVLRTALREATLVHPRVALEPDAGIDFYEIVNQYQAQLILSALELSGGRQNRAAELLNMRKSTLCTKIKQLKIKP